MTHYTAYDYSYRHRVQLMNPLDITGAYIERNYDGYTRGYYN